MTAPAARAVTQEFRRQQQQLNAKLLRDLTTLWPLIDWRRLSETYPAFQVAAATLVLLNRDRMATLAAGYLHAFQIAAGHGQLVDVKLAEAAPPEQITTSLLVTGPVAFKTAIRGGATVERAAKTALVTSSGSVSRLVLAAGRDTIVGTTLANPHANGWQRVTSGHPCAFCAMLASRGAVYGEAAADFEAHDHCSCTAEPNYGAGAPTGKAASWDDLYQQSAQGHDDQLNRFRRAYDAAAA